MSNFIDFEPGKHIKSLPEEGVEVYLNQDGSQLYFLTSVGNNFIFEGGILFRSSPTSRMKFIYNKSKKVTHLLLNEIKYEYDEVTKEPTKAFFNLEEENKITRFEVSLVDCKKLPDAWRDLEAGVLLFKELFKADVFKQARIQESC